MVGVKGVIPVSLKRVVAALNVLFSHPGSVLALRIYLGSIFVIAGAHKILHTMDFAQNIADYQIVPYWAVSLLAVLLPWLELTCGVLLLIGFRVRSASLIACFLLLLFSFGIAVNMIRGTSLNCGCFAAQEALSWKSLVRDLLWVTMGAHIFYRGGMLQLEDLLRYLGTKRFNNK